MAIDNFKGKHVDKCGKYLEKTQWMQGQDLKRLQLKRLKALLRYAYENVSYYHASFKSKRLRPEDIQCLEDLHKVPILKKSEIRRELDRMIPENISKEELIVRYTSGTAASPVKFYTGKKDFDWALGAELRAHSWAGYELGDKIAYVWMYEPEEIRSLQFRLYNLVMRRKILDVYYMSEETMASFAIKMVRFRPDFILGYSGSTNLFANFLLQNGHYMIRPKAVFTSASTLLPHYRRAIEEAFKCKVYDFYGSREVPSIAAQCGHHEGLHVTEENIMLEIVEDDEPVSPGEYGRILLTNLHSYTMPFIRYDIGDLGQIFPEVCSCGRELSLLKPIGRTYEQFRNSDGSFTCLRDFQVVFEDLPIKDFQVEQKSADNIVIRIVGRSGYGRAHTDFILRNIKLRGRAETTVELVDSIPTEKSGKTLHIIKKRLDHAS